MAFFHEDGFVPAWNFAARYAEDRGHIATLPEIVEARLASADNEPAWHSYFTTSSAEYYGTGADGTAKLIIAHGVGPMSTFDGIMKAYAWEYKDKDGHRNGGRITAQEFLDLEAGRFGEVTVIHLDDYVTSWKDPFYEYHSIFEAKLDRVLMARLGPKALQYLQYHDDIARRWHEEESVRLPKSGRPYILQNSGSSNCPYTTSPMVDGKFDWSRTILRPLEDGYAIGHLLTFTQPINLHFGEGHGLVADIRCQQWTNNFRFLSLPRGTSASDAMVHSPQPHNLLRSDEWPRFMRPNADVDYVPPPLFRIEETDAGWFTRYPKKSDSESMDDGDIEFRVQRLVEMGDPERFIVDDDFFLRYRLSTVIALAPNGANAYDIVDVSNKDSAGLTTVTVQFYAAEVDTWQRLPRVKDIKQDYDLLMGG